MPRLVQFTLKFLLFFVPGAPCGPWLVDLDVLDQDPIFMGHHRLDQQEHNLQLNRQVVQNSRQVGLPLQIVWIVFEGFRRKLFHLRQQYCLRNQFICPLGFSLNAKSPKLEFHLEFTLHFPNFPHKFPFLKSFLDYLGFILFLRFIFLIHSNWFLFNFLDFALFLSFCLIPTQDSLSLALLICSLHHCFFPPAPECFRKSFTGCFQQDYVFIGSLVVQSFLSGD